MRPTSSALFRLTSIRRASYIRAPLTSAIPSAPYDASPLRGTAPPSSSTLIVHLPVPPPRWPPKLEASGIAPLVSSLSTSLRQHDTKLNPPMSVSAKADGLPLGTNLLFAWDGEGMVESLDGELGHLTARYFLPGKEPVDILLPSVNASSVSTPSSSPTTPPVALKETEQDRLVVLPEREHMMDARSMEGHDEIDVYVCTHGARDCRCSDAGGALVDTLREEIDRSGVQGRVKVWEISHLGGHKWAANVLIFSPSAHHLLGNLRPAHAPLLLSSLLSLSPSNPLPREILPFWRGSPGMTKDVMLAIHDEVAAEVLEEPKQADKTWEVVFKTWDGEEIRRVGQEGESVMELGKREELGAMEGVCGGVLECATCHCFLTEEPYPAPVDEPSEMEDDMLSSAIMRKDSSRLGCQIKVNEALAEWCKKGGRIGLPRY